MEGELARGDKGINRGNIIKGVIMCENCERLQEELDHAREIILGLVEDLQAMKIEKDWDELDQRLGEK